MGDLFDPGDGNTSFTCINVSNNAALLSGWSAMPMQHPVSSNRPVALKSVKRHPFESTACSVALTSHVPAPSTRLFESKHTRVMSPHSPEPRDALAAALTACSELTTELPVSNGLTDLLKLVAHMIGRADASSLGEKRQVFFVAMDGFDTHDALGEVHGDLQAGVVAARRPSMQAPWKSA